MQSAYLSSGAIVITLYPASVREYISFILKFTIDQAVLAVIITIDEYVGTLIALSLLIFNIILGIFLILLI